MRRLGATTALAGALSLFAAPSAWALPTGGQVAAGQASIASGGRTLTVTQSSPRAVLNWTGFDIGAGEAVRFNQPSSSSIALNRVTGSQSPSQILGTLSANGRVWLVNPSGVFFGKGAKIDVAGLVASATDIDNSRFMAGDYRFDIPGRADASIVNEGAITVQEAGLAALVAPTVSNRGTITARLGKVQLASGDAFILDLYGDGLINLQASPAITRQLIENSGTIQADGGQVLLTTAAVQDTVNSLINMDGVAQAQDITVTGNVVSLTGGLQASRNVNIAARNVGQQGRITAGRSVKVEFSGAYIDNASSVTQAQGGTLSLLGGTGSSLFASGHYDVSGNTGGSIAMTADNIWLYASSLDASGALGGGSIAIGGEYQGGGTLRHAQTVAINPYTTIKADAVQSGNGGPIVVWSDQETRFGGVASAKGGPAGGNGGPIEISSAGQDYVSGTADASAPNGQAGQVLLDPHNLTIATDPAGGGGFMNFELVNPDPGGGGYFGSYITPLSTGNTVMTDYTDSFAANFAGAAYLFNGATGALISTLRGSNADDFVGASVLALTNGNYIVVSSQWNGNRGEVTWGSGMTGITGTVDATNSLVGSHVGDQVGYNFTALTNGNYVVSSKHWNGDMGATTWGSGTTGITGTVDAINSLVGSNAGDQVSLGGVTALTNGNYVVMSYFWNGGNPNGLGAATWGNGTTGVTGTIDATNSLVGSNAGDHVGASVLALTNGNYVVRSYHWNGGLGAVTWGNGTTGIVGTIDATNSLVGSNAGDQVGIGNVTALTNGNYVVSSPVWNGNLGAATWGNGTTGITGTIDATNSLVGSNAFDNVSGPGGVIALTNGNYVVQSQFWDDGVTVNVGAATWGNGTTGITGTVDATNSLVGSNPGDQVGGHVTALTNGNYVVNAYHWNNDMGAATWVNGSNGHTSNNSNTVSAANSLVGSNAFDGVGDYGLIALSNGNYVVVSGSWNNGTGASTWGSGTSGAHGPISAANSVLGSVADYGMNYVYEDTVNGTYLTSFAYSASQRLFAAPSSGDINSLNFAFLPAADFTIDPAFLASVLSESTATPSSAATISRDVKPSN